MEEKKTNQELSTEEVKLCIEEVISQVKENREKVRLASKSGELKRNAFVNLDEKGILNPDAIVREWDLIQERKSSLSSNQRNVVKQIVVMALQKAAIKKAREAAQAKVDAEEAAQEEPKAKRSRKKKSEKSDSDK